MNNFVTASVEFFYNGEKISASVELDLNTHIEQNTSRPHIYLILARSINIDLYSYEYEMMQTENIVFSNAKGMVANYLTDGILDIEALIYAHKQHTATEKLTVIARNTMAVEDLSSQPELKQALLDAYQLGLDEAENKD